MSQPTVFDPNEGAKRDEGWAALPVSEGQFQTPVYSADQYADVFAKSVEGYSNIQSFLRDTVQKAEVPPSLQSFAQISMMPDSYNRGVVQPPGFPPNVLLKIADEHLAPKAVIQLRCADVARYSTYSSQPWKPGWQIVLREGLEAPTDSDKRDIRETRRFIENCSSEAIDARQRDALGLMPFGDFLDTLVRDRFRLDGVAIWTDMDLRNRVKSFKTMPAANIRLTDRSGYNNNKEVFAVGLDDGGRVQHEFTRKQLAYAAANRRPDANVFGYGYSELEMCARIIQAFTQSFDMNADIFNKNSIPNGVLKAKGMWTQRQLDVLSRIWQNLKKGTSKTWALPVISTPKDGDLEIMDLSRLVDHEAYYQNFTNMLMGLYATICNVPVRRLGYFISGGSSDNSEDSATTPATMIDMEDPGLPPLLSFIERLINEYLVWTRAPHLEFRFTCKNPKEDARAYEARMNAMTWGERRAVTDLPPVLKLAKGVDKKIAKLFDLIPSDPNLSSVFGNIITASMKADDEEKSDSESEMDSKIDPARSEQHGHASGVRRDSKAEAASAAVKKGAQGDLRTLYVSRPVLNAGEIIAWAKKAGFEVTVPADDMHVTQAFSRAKVDWFDAGQSANDVYIPAGGPRMVRPLGDQGGVVLELHCPSLQDRWQQFQAIGCSWDYESYRPHVTISYDAKDLDIKDILAFQGTIHLGPETFAVVNDKWTDTIEER